MATIGNRTVRRQAGLASELAAAFEHHRAGRVERAAAVYRKILNKMPDNPDALHLLGVIALGEGRPERAVQLIGKAVAAVPDFAEAHSNLGNAQRAAGRLGEACVSYRRAIALQPDFALAHNNLGRILCEQGDFAAALASCERAVALGPHLAETHNNLGNALRALGRLDAAEAAFRRALQLEPDSAGRLTNLANVLADLDRRDEALTCYRRAIVLDPGYVLAHYGLATRLRLSGDMEEALESYREVLQLSPGQAVAWNDLGRALRALGRLDEAVDAFRRALAIDPDFADAYRNLAAFGQLTPGDQEIARLAGLAAKPGLPIEERAAAGFALAKALDDADRFDEAFAAYDCANRIYRDFCTASGQHFDAEALRRRVDQAIDGFTPGFFGSVVDWGNRSELPVFVLGMPRSGTSLVEQIAASHSHVFGAGELRDIGHMVDELGPIVGEQDRAAIRGFADAHLERLRALGRGAERVLDKLPDNVFALGVIATLFPGARVVFCRRDPRDICLSCYFQKFSARQLVFSYDLADCAKRYLETERLTRHWHRVLPLRMLDVQYEALVDDLEGESRRLISFLGLDWEPACLDFHRTQRTVTTASGWQVRQPLYDRSVGRWRNYARHLAPLLDALGETDQCGASFETAAEPALVPAGGRTCVQASHDEEPP
jgi:tetratricopeptide (TPR) repeat protein